MGFETAPLLHGEAQTHITEHTKERIKSQISSQLFRKRIAFPVVTLLVGIVGVGLTVGGFLLKNRSASTVMLSVGIAESLLCLIYIGVAIYLDGKNVKLMELSRSLFDHDHITSWTYDSNTWQYASAVKFPYMNKRLWFVLALVLFSTLLNGFLFVFLTPTLAVNIRLAVMGSVAFFNFLIFAIIFGYNMRQRLRSFDPSVHSCVMGNGMLYDSGTLYFLQPAVAYRDRFIYNLKSITLEDLVVNQSRGDTIPFVKFQLVLNGNTVFGLHEVKCPVPVNQLPQVVNGIYKMAEGYTPEVTINTRFYNHHAKPVETNNNAYTTYQSEAERRREITA